MNIDWKLESQRFDQVAEQYETYRPGYPLALVEALIEGSELEPGDRILEVGSGTGKATEIFAERGFLMTCLEPGHNLSNVAASKFSQYGNIKFVNARFEEWDSPRESFKALISAQAYHWMPKEIRMHKAAYVLQPEGHLALFWNMPSKMDSSLRHDLDEAYRRIAPEMNRGEKSTEEVIQEVSAEIRDCGLFREPRVERFPWDSSMDAKTYLGLIGTFSDHLRLPDERRNSLFEAIAEAIDRHGRVLEQQILAVLYLAQKR